MMMKIEGRRCIVVGGGKVAERKTEGLLQAKANVTIVSPRLTPLLQQWSEAGSLHWIKREAVEADLTGATLIFAATDLPEINKWVFEVAEGLAIPVNIADDGELGSFINPAVLRRGELVLTASASGAGPALATRIIQELSAQYGPEYKRYIETLRAIRAIVKDEVADASERRALLKAAVTDEALQEWQSGSLLQDKERLIARLRQRADELKG
ncbi:precorrin-2 dehydrogenase [Cohnella abietis]|uniref:precorrin-2 dehydrogenase n=2 Tax=Cohnella abietis TaxID=2507935 RepID=A0A3T1D327_9BACL|nr:precorrin-2 dehydrogenase [Cohnella abietis]